MKKLIVALFALVSVSAIAAPRVGDTATHNVSIQGMGTGTTTSTITAFDASTQVYTVKTDSNFNGQMESEEELTPAADMATEDMIADILTNCVAYGGVNETITVAAGTFAVCTANGTSIGQVPFALVKMVATQNGMTISAELASMARGR